MYKTKPRQKLNPFNYPVGITSYENFFSHDELLEMERNVDQTEAKCENRAFLPMTAQQTFSKQGAIGQNPAREAKRRLVRTKFFFGYRYMWTKEQLSEPYSHVAAGVRSDVSKPPLWVKKALEEPMYDAKLAEKDFFTSIALNVYHDGTEGLAQHYDDATRFK